MIKHVVCFKLKEPTPENCLKTKEVLISMSGKVPQLRGIEVGIDFLRSERSYDVILEVMLDGKSDLDAYQNDPYHVDVVKKHMHSVSASSVSMDYELDYML